ncbi:MAG: blue (type 1) copper domain protein [Gemmatimonadetes bacterium]|nr:blue (type 1) copper domain protein [Gemmatimonadota bacterium]
MPFTWQISINRSRNAAGYVYAPAVLDPVAIGDEIIFINNDSTPHWPGLVDATGMAPSSATYFMRYQIPPHTSSTPWVPGVNGTVSFADSLDTKPSPPAGTIVVAGITTVPE